MKLYTFRLRKMPGRSCFVHAKCRFWLYTQIPGNSESAHTCIDRVANAAWTARILNS